MTLWTPDTAPPERDDARKALWNDHRADETASVEALVRLAAQPADAAALTERRARDLVHAVRAGRRGIGGLDGFLEEYDLSSAEGVALMCLAEALLRVPDADTADELIRDKIGDRDWRSHLGHSSSLLVNASSWALMLTGRVMALDSEEESDGDYFGTVLGRLVARSGEPVIRTAVRRAMRILGRQFVMGRTIAEALKRAAGEDGEGYRYSFDMLGEGARTARDAERYLEAYEGAIAAIGAAADGRDPVTAPGISVKLSALHPRYEFAQRDRVMAELLPRLVQLCQRAAEHNIGLTVDAEECDRLDLSLDVIAAAASDPLLAGWDGFGLALQAYQKRAYGLIGWLEALAGRSRRRLMVRLVKGAYWDTEIKRAQEGGHDDYPVFTRKHHTDVSYLACARALLAAPKAFYPQFATHNAHTVAAVTVMAGATPYEFQRLHGMGQALYQHVSRERGQAPCRVYAPVGSHEDLLAYLVRRLLENGANTSFVNRIVDDEMPVSEIIADPVAAAVAGGASRHPAIPLPPALYPDGRRNSAGLDLADEAEVRALDAALTAALADTAEAAPRGAGLDGAGTPRPVRNPADPDQVVGEVREASPDSAARAMDALARGAPAWEATPAEKRAAILRRAADLLEDRRVAFFALCVREAGKCLPDAVAEIREAVDFLRYYADRAEAEFAAAAPLPGPTGESNSIRLHGRGVFACISPWNFPLAIFTGQVAAALAAGNAVAAKPAEQTPLIADRMTALLHEAGVPESALALLPGDGAAIGGALLSHPALAGVAFTGSTETARIIQQALARRQGPLLPLIAETGGQNAMIVDSTALPEQVAVDVLASSFQSAGQRCSALRLLYLQEDVADRFIAMLTGAMAELRLGDPARLATDVGPVIDAEAKAGLERHIAAMTASAKPLQTGCRDETGGRGHFVVPHAFELERPEHLVGEVFGPILHVVRFAHDRLDQVVDSINASGYGLTLGVHSRIDSTVARIVGRARVGNLYVNRNTIGAIVGVQPFGGEGLSGTGPKAGGPRYLHRYATERVVSVNTTASGGNAQLMSLQDSA